MKHVDHLVGQFAQMTSAVEEVTDSVVFTTLSAFYQCPVVPDNHALEEFSAILLCGIEQTIIWVIFAGDHCDVD